MQCHVGLYLNRDIILHAKLIWGSLKNCPLENFHNINFILLVHLLLDEGCNVLLHIVLLQGFCCTVHCILLLTSHIGIYQRQYVHRGTVVNVYWTCCISSDMSAFFITAFLSDILSPEMVSEISSMAMFSKNPIIGYHGLCKTLSITILISPREYANA